MQKVWRNKWIALLLFLVVAFTLIPAKAFAAPEVKTIKLSSDSVTMSVNEGKNLKATVYPSSVSKSAIRWKSSDTSIATVTSKGKIKAKGPGDAIITAYSSNGKSSECEVTVVGYLDRLRYSEKVTEIAENTIAASEGYDDYSVKCKRTMRFIVKTGKSNYQGDTTVSSISYNLGGKYTTFISRLTHRDITMPANIQLIGDGEILYESMWKNDTAPEDLDIDVTGISIFTIRIESNIGGWSSDVNDIIFDNARFVKE